jgi:hypothetical protein
MRRLALISLFLVVVGSAWSQDSLRTVHDFLGMVQTSHPIAQQAQLTLERSDWELVGARGFLDPKLVSDFQTKDFSERNYYDLWNTYLLVPTPLNIDFKVGFEQNSGYYLNPENTVPDEGLYYAGVSVPLGRGLLFNDNMYGRGSGMIRGRELKNDATIILNNLYYQANDEFWETVAYQQQYRVISDALALYTEYFEGVVQSVLNGDKPPIDTVESLIQVQKLRIDLGKSQLDLNNQLLELSNLSWSDLVFTGENFSTEHFDLQTIDFFQDFARSNHPVLNQLNLNNDQLTLDRRYYAEQIRPQLDFNYNFLLSDDGINDSFSTNNYKAGVTFSIPLFLRKERSKLRMARLKLTENELKYMQKEREILNKVEMAYNNVLTTQELVRNQQEIVANFEIMLEGERAKFDNGESSIFLVNSRQNKLLEAQMKLIELEMSYRKYIGKLYWQAGYFPELMR